MSTNVASPAASRPSATNTPGSAPCLLAPQQPPAHERRWAHGAGGEEMVAEALAKRCRPEIVVLHDRAIPGSRANIDHIAIAPSGVWVIDTMRYTAKIEVATPVLGPAKLKVGGRDQTKLVAGLVKQLDIVTPVVEAVIRAFRCTARSASSRATCRCCGR